MVSLCGTFCILKNRSIDSGKVIMELREKVYELNNV